MTSIISSSVWGRDIKSPPPKPGNVDALTVHWVGSSSYNRKKDKIADGIKAIEKSQMRSNSSLSCVSYNFLVDKFGRIWEGRGFAYRNAANGANANNLTSMSVCVLVGQADSTVTPEILSGLKALYSEVVKHYGRSLKVECHSDVRATQCPGSALTALVRSGRIQEADANPTPAVSKPSVNAGHYVVKSGDSYWKVSQEVLKDGSRWKEISDLNNGKPLFAGESILIPSSIPQPAAPVPAPPAPTPPAPKPPAPKPTTPTSSTPSFPKFPGKSIRLGDSGENVRAIQTRLAQRGFYSLRIDGSFGPMTDISVKHFQRRHARPVDGIVGSVTWSALFS